MMMTFANIGPLGVDVAQQAQALAEREAADQEHGDEGEAGCQAEPDADTAQVEHIAQEPGDGQADEPVAENGHDHGHLGVAQAAQRMGRNHLGAIDELKQSGNGEIGGGEDQSGLVLWQGRIEEQGKPDDLFGNPQKERTQQFLSAVKEAS